ncbi:MAG: hypothetical protein QOH25_3963 [Acidobacteriota bacterium]|jgi:hypothetical protein|nr:hypothetical protein [Acidobacteriota bacterium]
MNSLLALVSLILCLSIAWMIPGYGASAIVLCAIFAALVGTVVSQLKENSNFLLRIFLGALLVRILVGTIIYIFNLQDFFGSDANTYDFFGFALFKVWNGEQFYQHYVNQFAGGEGMGGGWGMLYLVAVVYSLIGRNMLAIQFINAVIGAATVPVIFLCALHIFNNLRVARISAIFVAFYPSLVLWSSQGLKDGPIIFLIGLSVLATLKLGERLSVKYLSVLVFSLIALLSLRFYILYLMVAAIAGAFIIGMRAITAQSFARQFVIVVLLGVSLTYLGAFRYASTQYETFGNLEALQRSRLDAAQQGESGFGRDIDVSTTSGAISAIPLGLTYLLFAPFPWQLASLRQSITLPEMIIWWASFPFLVVGLWFTIKFRLRQASPVLIFTAMLTLMYSLFQGNVGNAYRHRAQLLIFLFIFVAVGYVLTKERREDKKRRELAARQHLGFRPVHPSTSNM